MKFSEVIGNEQAIGQIRRMIDADRLPHALLLYGEPGVPKLGLAMAAAQTDFARSLTTAGTEYFAEARLTRQVSRDEALELLQTAASSEAASQETIDSAMNAISRMAACSMQEAQIENLLLAKEFDDCVVYIGEDAITVAVPAPMEGLSEEAVARITDVICTETSYGPEQLNIIEVKA